MKRYEVVALVATALAAAIGACFRGVPVEAGAFVVVVVAAALAAYHNHK